MTSPYLHWRGEIGRRGSSAPDPWLSSCSHPRSRIGFRFLPSMTPSAVFQTAVLIEVDRVSSKMNAACLFVARSTIAPSARTRYPIPIPGTRGFLCDALGIEMSATIVSHVPRADRVRIPH